MLKKDTMFQTIKLLTMGGRGWIDVERGVVRLLRQVTPSTLFAGIDWKGRMWVYKDPIYTEVAKDLADPKLRKEIAAARLEFRKTGGVPAEDLIKKYASAEKHKGRKQ